jgi:uroporphyrinogen decarboxylase
LLEYLIALTRSWGALGVDAMYFTDDWGTQTSLMISPAMWRSYFKDLYRKLFDEVHRLGMQVIFHSCGNVMSIVPDLIDVGLDVLDPLQPRAMDVAEVAKRFGRCLSFSGGIDVQNLLVFGSPRQIKDAVRQIIDTLGCPAGGGLIVAPANLVTPEVPLENFRALFEACHQK